MMLIPISLDSRFLIQISVRRLIDRETSENHHHFPTNSQVAPHLLPLEHSLLDLTAFEEGSVRGPGDDGSNQIYRRRTDACLVVVKSIFLSASIERCQIESEIENPRNLRHPMTGPLVRFAFPVVSSEGHELTTVRSHAVDGSLAAVLSARPAPWTPTAKAKEVAEIAFAVPFRHGLGLLHGGFFQSRTSVQPVSTRSQVSLFWAKGRRRVPIFPRLLPFIPLFGAAGSPLVAAGVPEFVAGRSRTGNRPNFSAGSRSPVPSNA
jgi:hypothetical protein